jgi:hypothetical protein
MILLTAVAGWAAAFFAVWQRYVVSRVVGQVQGQPVEWHFRPRGVTTTSLVDQTYAAWELGRNAVLTGDMLVVRRGGAQVVGYLAGPLSAEQRRRVFGWVEAGSGRRVLEAR